MLGSNRLQYIAFGLALVLAFPGLGQEPVEPQNRPFENQNTATEPESLTADEPATKAEPTPTPIPTAEPISQDHDGKRQRHENGESQEPPRPTENFAIWGVWGDTPAQWIMAASGLAAVGISVWAVLLLRRTLSATRDAVQEARNTTAVARDALNESRLSNQRQLRAYLHTADQNIKIIGAETAAIQIKLVNAGQTPAHNIVARAAAHPIDKSNENEIPVFNASSEAMNFGFIGPNGDAKWITIKMTIKPEYIPLIQADTHAVFAYGRVTYEDAFGDPQWVRFRLIYEGEWAVGQDTDLSLCREGNEAT